MNQDTLGNPRRRSMTWRGLVLATGLSLLAPSLAQADSADFGDVHVTYNLRLGYALAMRMSNPDPVLINGPVDQFQSSLLPSVGGGQSLGQTLDGVVGGLTGILGNLTGTPVGNSQGQVFSFSHQGLPSTINADDGDRNFDKYALIHNRVTALAQMHLTWRNYGIKVSGTGFYDQAYHTPNDNNSDAINRGILPNTVNTLGPGGQYPDPRFNHFTRSTRHFDGQRLRWLEAYAYGDWGLWDGAALDVRAGRQLVAWGQSLFFTGLALSQSRANAAASFVPGASVKSLLLPTNQISFRLQASRKWTFVGYYKFQFAKTELFPEGDYFSPSDLIGPGASFVYSAANPLAGGNNSCDGLFSNIHVAGMPAPNGLDSAICNVLGPIGTAVNRPPFIIARRGPNIEPSRWGQYGMGVEYQLTPITTVGFYYLRYADNNPAVNLNVGYAPITGPIAALGNKPITTQLLNQAVPVSYNIKYFGGIHMYSLAYSTVLGPFNVGGEFNYRDGVDIPVRSIISGVVGPVFTRGKVSQALISALYVTNPNFFFDDFIFTGEAGFVHTNSIDRVPDGTKPGGTPGITTEGTHNLGDGRIVKLGNGRTLFYSKNAWGFEFLAIPTKHNIFDGWDLSMPISFAMLVKGTPEMAGAFGALYGEGDTRLGVGLSFKYLQNLTLAFGYNMFFGDANKKIGPSLLPANPYVDRDYATFTITYHVF